MSQRTLSLLLFIVLCIAVAPLQAGDLVRIVRNKISAGDIFSGAAAAEDYKRTTGVDAEYLDAIGWLARGAEMMRMYDRAAGYVAELRREIKAEKDEVLIPLGAAIEVEGRLRIARQGRGAALHFLNEELARAQNISLRSRIGKTINQLALEGSPAPVLNMSESFGPAPTSLAAYKGQPVLLFLWANWCGDCKSQAGILSRVAQKYRTQGLAILAPTRLYGSIGDKTATPEEEKAHVAKVWKESYPGLENVPVIFDTEGMVRYGASATPTFVLIDRQGFVRCYTPTRLSEAELSQHIDTLLSEPK